MEMINGTTIDKLPLCGVMAVANCAGVAIQDAFETFKAKCKKSSSWKGATRSSERNKMLKYYKVKFTEAKVGKCSLAKFIDWNTAKNKKYIVRTGGHVQVVENGLVTDQRGTFPIDEFWGKRKIVTHVLVIK